MTKVSVMVSVLALVAASHQPSMAAEAEQPVRVSQLMHARPIGLLGEPLGEHLVVEGTLAEWVLLSNPIAIARVDGRALPKVVKITLTGDRAPRLEKNVNYRLEGFESGKFGGPPDWLAPDAPQPQQPFQYHPSFVVTRVIEPSSGAGTAADWRNPYLVVHADGVEITGIAGRFAPESLPDALAKLSKDAWPYGKVVAVQETGIRSGNDDRLIGENLTKVLKLLKERGIKVERWPSN